MDLRHHGRILRRWKNVVIIGLIGSVVVAVLATFSPGPTGLKWRTPATYTSKSRIWVTQPGFPVGRATLPGADTGQLVAPKKQAFAPPERFSELAVFYSYLAASDQVRNLIKPRPAALQLVVSSVPNPITGDPLPLLDVTSTASSSDGARELNTRAIEAMRGYIEAGMKANRVPGDERVELQVLNPPKAGILTAGRSPTRSVMLFLLGIVATMVAVYVLENLYPSGRARQDHDADLMAIGELFAEPDEPRETHARRSLRPRGHNRVA
jgi:hypothetical protein